MGIACGGSAGTWDDSDLRDAVAAWRRSQVGLSRYTRKFAWYPRRCPATKRWFWMRWITLHEVAYYRLAEVGPELWPALGFELKTILTEHPNYDLASIAESGRG